MWIRTECGIITNRFVAVATYQNIVRINDLRYKIKKQGDNLIDVLEVGDIVKLSNGKNMMIDKILEKKIVGSKMIHHMNQVKQIITHEQYMPLAQEV